MADLRNRIESARQVMKQVADFLSAPNRLLMDEHQQRLTAVATELRGILEDAAKVPDQERSAVRIPLEALQREVQLSRALVLQAAGIFQSFDEPADSEPALYSPSPWQSAARV